MNYWRDNAFNVTYQDNSAAWLFGGKDVILDGEGTGTVDGNGQVCGVASAWTING